MKRDIVTIGSSISGSIAAAYLKHRHPDLSITVIGRINETLPIVGESLTEYSTFLLREIGLGQVLEEQHFHKYGLTFYFKENLENPLDRTYSMHEAIEIPPLPSKQLNRFEFDKQIIKHAQSLGVEYIDGSVESVDSNGSDRFTVNAGTEATGKLTVGARWLVDASGRRRFLASKFGLKEKSSYQRSVFWFRLVDFDERILSQINAVKSPQYSFDSYYVTHHFFGRGNWIWCIPMRTPEYRNMISIGIVWRPDIYKDTVNNLETFFTNIDKEHPVVCELTRSGKVIDTNFYSKYMYGTKQVYSTDGWFIIGDAGNAVDPLYSTGIVMTSLQATQISELIRLERADKLTSTCVRELESSYLTIWRNVQDEISTLFEVMHDPYQSSWRMHMASLQYFYFLLPAWLSGYMIDPGSARWIRSVMEKSSSYHKNLLELLNAGAQRVNFCAHQLPNRYNRTVNWQLRGPCNGDISKFFSKMLYTFSCIHFELLKNAGWKDFFRNFRLIIQGLTASLLFQLTFRDPRNDPARVLHQEKGDGHY